MRRLLLIAALALLALAAPAGAHPLGNFSINHLAVVRASSDRVDVRYVLDQAEIPTFQERGLTPARALARKRADVARGVTLTVGGRPVALTLRPGGRITFPRGAGGLHTTRVEVLLSAQVAPRGAVVVRDATFAGRVGWRAVLVEPGHGTAVHSDVTNADPTQRLRVYPTALLASPADRTVAHLRVSPGNGTVTAPRGAVVVRDATFAGRVGWRAVLVEPGHGTAVHSDLTSADPTHRLRVYPTALLASPADRTVAHLRVSPGNGTVTAPRGDGSQATTTDRGAGDGLGSVFERAAEGQGVLLLLLLAAFGWGAVHALSPGHGKAMVAAYLVGTRGTARHALALGLTVTITHTIGVFALGAVALALSAYVLPEQLYPWLNLASGLLVLGVGASVVRGRLRRARTPASEHHHHHRDHDHHHEHGHDHHHHDHADLRPRALLAMGASAGLIPCPSALVVLLGAVAQHQIGLGMVLIVAFSAGLAATLTGLGLLVVAAGRVSTRLSGARAGRVLTVLPALSALAIVAVGLALTAQAVPKVL